MCHTHEAKYDFKQNVFAHYMHFTNSFNSAQTSCVNHRNNGEFIPASVGPLVSTNSIRNQVIFMLLMQAGDSPIVNWPCYITAQTWVYNKLYVLTPECMVTLVAYQLIRWWFTLVWKINCIKAPKGQLHSSSYNINTILSEGVVINALESC